MTLRHVQREARPVWRLAALAAGAALLVALGAAPASAAGIVVTSLGDGQGNDGSCILREAIINANADDQSGSFDCAAGSGADTIIFSVHGTVTLTAALPPIGSDLKIDGGGAVTIDGAKAYRPFTIAGGAVTLAGLTVTHGKLSSDGRATANGGGIWNAGTLTVTNSTISANEAFDYGGGIWNATGATLTVTNTTISGNTSFSAGSVGGGGIANGDFRSATGGTVSVTNSTISGNFGWFGGGVLNFGTVTVTSSTISRNEAADSGGGGLYNFGTLTIANSTISGNLAYGGGGGISNEDFSNATSATLTVTNATISGNTSWGYGGGIDNHDGTLDLANTIVAGNTHISFAAPTVSDLYGPLAANTHNLVGIPAGETLGDILVLDGNGWTPPDTSQMLSVPLLASNGGPTQTIALAQKSGNPAIDAGDGPTCAAAPVSGLDQRGLPRPAGAGCDIGAYEAQTPTPSAPSRAVAIRSKLGLPAGGGSYTTATKVSPLGGYITWRADLGTGVSGQPIGVWVAARRPDGTWGPFSRLTNRLADGSGVVTFSLRQMKPAWLSVRFSSAGVTTLASQARWK